VRTLVVLIALAQVGVALLPAQQRATPFLSWDPAAVANPPTISVPANEAKSEDLGDYRHEGLALGGLVLGVAGAWIGSRISNGCPLEAGVSCPSDKAEQAVGLGVAGAVLGGGLGYLVGRLSPKRAPRVEPDFPPAELVGVPDSVRKRTGYQHWRGGAIGFAAGGALGALLGAALGNGCSDCSTAAGGRVFATALAGAGAGGVLGFLAGLASPKYVWVLSTGR
jgi:hypothetical protein